MSPDEPRPVMAIHACLHLELGGEDDHRADVADVNIAETIGLALEALRSGLDPAPEVEDGAWF